MQSNGNYLNSTKKNEEFLCKLNFRANESRAKHI